MLNKSFIGVAGYAQSGKDLFISLLSKRLPQIKRFALADALKATLDPEIQSRFGFSIFNCTPTQKEIARPFLVEWGKNKRAETNGRYFIDILAPKILEYKSFNRDAIICVSDIRYDDERYASDEADWVKKENNGILVHIQKYRLEGPNRVFVQPANSEEAKNDPFLIKKANYRIIWPDISYNSKLDDLEKTIELNDHIDEFLKYLRYH